MTPSRDSACVDGTVSAFLKRLRPSLADHQRRSESVFVEESLVFLERKVQGEVPITITQTGVDVRARGDALNLAPFFVAMRAETVAALALRTLG